MDVCSTVMWQVQAVQPKWLCVAAHDTTCPQRDAVRLLSCSCKYYLVVYDDTRYWAIIRLLECGWICCGKA